MLNIRRTGGLRILVAVLALALVGPAVAQADVNGWDFEDPPFTVGNINGQDGWSKTNSSFDSFVVANSAGHPFGDQSLRISNAVTSGSFSDQTISPSLVDSAGETSSVDRGVPVSSGVRQPTFEASFRFQPTVASEQPGLAVTVSPDNGVGDRMSFVRLEDTPAGIDVVFFDTPDEALCAAPLPSPGCFASQTIATGLDRSVPHDIRFKITFVDGDDNDVVEVYVNGSLAVTGKTWENYYRNSPEQLGNGNLVAATDALLFRVSGTAAPGTSGAGFLFDDVEIKSGPPASPAYSDVVLADNPVGYWRFGESSGTVATDSSGNGNDGTYLNGALLGQAGALVADSDTAALFDGVNDEARVPHAASLNVGSVFTAEGWVKRSTATQSHTLMLKGAGGLQLVVMNAANGNQVWLRKAGITTIARSSVGVPADGEFHHVAVTMDGPGTAKIYVDGQDVTVPIAGQHLQVIQNTALPLRIAGAAGSSAAVYDEFALYSTPLSAADISARYAFGVVPIIII